jgi:fibronectin type 3 domain-containing protein
MNNFTKIISVALLVLFASGCKQFVNEFVDTTPPARPAGLWTETGDNFIELFWDKNRESDVAGYNVFVSSSYDGRYELIGSVRNAYFNDAEA